MSKERELLKQVVEYMWVGDIVEEIKELLAQPEQEQEPVTDKPTETAMAVMPNGVCVSNVYDAYEEGRKSVMSEQEPVAWIIETEIDGKLSEWVCTDKKHYMDASDGKDPIPLYTSPPKREPLTSKLISLGNNCHESFIKGVRFAEKMHGIGGGE